MLESGMAQWKDPTGPPVAYKILVFRPNYAETASQAPLYQEMLDLKNYTTLFKLSYCWHKTTNEYGILFLPWHSQTQFTTFPPIQDNGQLPFWFGKKPKPSLVIRDRGPPQDRPDKYWMNMHILQRIGYLEMEALQLHLTKRHKHCPPLTQPSLLPDPSLAHSYLTDRRVTTEWQVKLCAQRTGELFLWGAQAWSPQTTLLPTTALIASPCPLCGVKTFNLSLHWFLNCQSFTAQYEKGAELQWQAILTHKYEAYHLCHPTNPCNLHSTERPPRSPCTSNPGSPK